MIYVCSLAELPTFAEAVRPSHLISLLGDDPVPPTPHSVAEGAHLKVHMHDIVAPAPGCTTPEAAQLEELIDFADRWRRAGPMVIHCSAGISRSTAAALVVLCRYNRGREAEAAACCASKRRTPIRTGAWSSWQTPSWAARAD